MYNLSLMLIRGEGGKADLPQAVKLLKAAADKQHAGALRELAFLHDEGRGVAKDSKLAAQYLIASYKSRQQGPLARPSQAPGRLELRHQARNPGGQLTAAGLYDGHVNGFINARTRAALDRLASAE